MLYILLISSILLIIIGMITCEKSKYHGVFYHLSDNAAFSWGLALTVISVISLLTVWGSYSYNKYTTDRQLLVLEEQNELVLNQIEPIVQKALEYESSTYKELQISTDKLIALGSMYPNLKDNIFIQTQMQVIIDNQAAIRDLKLVKARLGGYRFWIWNKD